MSKDYRREKSDFESNDWMSSGEGYRKGKDESDIKRRRRASKKMAQARERQDQYH